MVVNPVAMAFGPDGRLYVIEWTAGRGPNDRIKVLTDDDGDGTFDRAAIHMDGLELPAGVLIWDGWTYVTLDHDVVRLKDKDGDGTFETREVIVTGFGNDNSHHRVSGMTLGPDGWLYLTTGDSDARARGADGSTATVLRCGGVFRCKPDGSRLENVAFGMRNPWGNVAFDDEFRIFHTDNDNEGTPDFTGCRLLHVVEGGDYGWRLREGARCCQPEVDRATWNGGRPGRLGAMTLTGRGAPAGLCVLNSPAFPPGTRNLLVYPDLFRKLVRAYRLRPSGATYVVDEEFELLASDEGYFRPDDAEVGPDGALYILDWRTDSGGAARLWGNGETGRIYRMTWGGTEQEAARPTFPLGRLIELLGKGEDDLIDALSSDDVILRNAASLELIRRRIGAGAKAGISLRLARLAADRGRPVHARLHSLAILQESGLVEVGDLSADPDPSVRRLFVEFTGRCAAADDAGAADRLLARMAKEDDPQCLRDLALALGHFHGLKRVAKGPAVDAHHRNPLAVSKPEKTGRLDPFGVRAASITADLICQELLRRAADRTTSDPFLRDGFTRGLERLRSSAVAHLVAVIESGDPERSGTALFALQGWRSLEDVPAILGVATSPGEIPETARVGLFLTLRELVDSVSPAPIARWLEERPLADPSARVEAIRLLMAMHECAQLAAEPMLPGLLDDRDADVRHAALVLAGEMRSKSSKAAIVEVVKSTSRPTEERRLAAAALRLYQDRTLAPMIASLFASGRDTGLRIELLRTLAALDFASMAGRAEGLLTDEDATLRHEAIALMGQRPATALVVANLYNAGKLPAGDLPRVIEAVRPHSRPDLQDALRVLLKKSIAAVPSGAEAQRLFEFVNRSGDAERGKEVFLDPKRGGCATCHRIEGVGGAVGPDLTRVYETLSYDKRMESILDPSKEIKEGFVTYKVATTDGRILSGLLLSDNPEGVTLKDAEGREVRVPAGEVEEKGPGRESLMPAGIASHLSLGDLADLLTFLGDRRAQESLRAGAGRQD